MDPKSSGGGPWKTAEITEVLLQRPGAIGPDEGKDAFSPGDWRRVALQATSVSDFQTLGLYKSKFLAGE